MLVTDKLKDMFARQENFMRLLEQADKIVQWPIDLTTKQGQRLIKEMMHNMNEELFEASYTLKNRMHKLSNDTEFDFDHYKEELGDALAWFLEICIMSGIDAEELYREYCRKNKIVTERFQNGY